METSGNPATLVSDGRTTHSVIKSPLNLSREEYPIYNVSKNSERSDVLCKSKLILWGETAMSRKLAI